MASTKFASEGQSTNRPPLFNGTNYTYWKTRMSFYLKSLDFDLWNIVVEGYKKPPRILVDAILVEKPPATYTDSEKKQASLDARAINALFCAVDQTEFNRVSTCTTSHEVWKLLEVTHEGTTQVKESKISRLTQEYEAFKMKPNETVTQMFARFLDIVNPLSSLGKNYNNHEKIRKVLRALMKNWIPKATTIIEGNDLTTMSLETLMGKLLTHELDLQDFEDAPKEKSIALKAQHKKTVKDDSEDSNSDDEDQALLVKKFKKFMRYNRRTKDYNNNNNNSEEEPVCYGCKKKGHI